MLAHLSCVARSNLYTMRLAEQLDPRNAVPAMGPVLPSAEVRKLRAQIATEEYLEKMRGLGFDLQVVVGNHGVANIPQAIDVNMTTINFVPNRRCDLYDIIDACVDQIYVATGTLLACGVPDLPHLAEVSRCNDAKFPRGVVYPHPSIKGKYGKPPGWVGPDHRRVISETAWRKNMREVQQQIVEAKKGA